MRLNLKVNMSNYPDTNVHDTLPKILKYRAETIPNTVALRDKRFRNLERNYMERI